MLDGDDVYVTCGAAGATNHDYSGADGEIVMMVMTIMVEMKMDDKTNSTHLFLSENFCVLKLAPTLGNSHRFWQFRGKFTFTHM